MTCAHAAVSLWLNAGVPATEVARRAGHGVAVLLTVYAHCIDGQAEAANHASPPPSTAPGTRSPALPAGRMTTGAGGLSTRAPRPGKRAGARLALRGHAAREAAVVLAGSRGPGAFGSSRVPVGCPGCGRAAGCCLFVSCGALPGGGRPPLAQAGSAQPGLPSRSRPNLYRPPSSACSRKI